MSESENEKAGDRATEARDEQGIGDEQIPEDLRPGEDNPLAEPLAEEDLEEGRDLEMTATSEDLGREVETSTDVSGDDEDEDDTDETGTTDDTGATDS